MDPLRLVFALLLAVSSTALAACYLDLDRTCADGRACGGRPLDTEGCRPPPELSLLTWNIEWFQHPERGPADEERQFEAVAEVLGRTTANLIALQEVSDPARFYELVDQLPDYAGVLTDHAWPQQLGLLFRPREFELRASGAITGLDDAGRPPLAVELVHASGASVLTVVVHAKAGMGESDHAHRERFARGLTDDLARYTGLSARVVAGDLNDRLTGSVVAGRASPYEALLAELQAPTAALESGPEPSTIWGDTVDHILVDSPCTRDAAVDRADVLRDELLASTPSYADVVSDHFPVHVRAFTREVERWPKER